MFSVFERNQRNEAKKLDRPGCILTVLWPNLVLLGLLIEGARSGHLWIIISYNFDQAWVWSPKLLIEVVRALRANGAPMSSQVGLYES